MMKDAHLAITHNQSIKSPDAIHTGECRAIVPVLRARFPHAQPERLPLVVRGRAASHHIHFLMDEEEEEEWAEADIDSDGGVACRALVLHPTKHKVNGFIRACIWTS